MIVMMISFSSCAVTHMINSAPSRVSSRKLNTIVIDVSQLCLHPRVLIPSNDHSGCVAPHEQKRFGREDLIRRKPIEMLSVKTGNFDQF